MDRLAKRAIHKLIRELSPYFDSHSLYFNLPPRRRRMSRLAEYAAVGEGARVGERIVAPTPFYLEMGSHVSLKSLAISPRKHVFIERGVQREEAVVCSNHSIITPALTHEGETLSNRRITLSVDVEGGVALSHADRDEWESYRKCWETKGAVERLAGLFEKYEIPATWAVCGHLFLEECAGRHEFFEQDWYGDWFKFDPATRSLDNSSWYMPETIRALAGSPRFEIAYHSFGHFRYQRCSEETLRADIAFAKKLRKEWGLPLESLVFPYNQLGFIDLLLDEGGFRNFRGNIGPLYPAYDVLDFGRFRFYNTTEMFSPGRMPLCLSQLDRLSKNTFNYYTHCHQWIEDNGWTGLEEWLRALARLRDSEGISIKKMSEP